MIEIIKKKTNIKFTNMFATTSVLSIILVLASLYLLFTTMKYGVDFRGGAEVQVKFAEGISVKQIRKSLTQAGFDGASVQTIGEVSDNEVLIKLQAKEEDLNKVEELSAGKVDLSIGSALDLFGGKTIGYADCVAWNNRV